MFTRCLQCSLQHDLADLSVDITPEAGIFRSCQFRIFCKDPAGILARVLQDLCILKYIGNFKIKDSALADPEQITGASKFQVFTGNKKTVVGMIQDVKPFFCLI